jgi:hypothetical protein
MAEEEIKKEEQKFVLTEQKGKMLEIFSMLGVMTGGKNALINPVILKVDKDKKSLTFESADKTQTVLMDGKWIPNTLDPGDIEELVINTEIVYQALQAMKDDYVKMTVTNDEFKVETPRRWVRLKTESKPSSEKLPKIPDFKKFMAEIEVSAEELKSVITDESKIPTPKKYMFTIDGPLFNIVSGIFASDKKEVGADVIGTIRALGKDIDSINSGYGAQVISTLFDLAPAGGKVLLCLGNKYILKITMSQPGFSINYYVSPSMDD